MIYHGLNDSEDIILALLFISGICGIIYYCIEYVLKEFK